MNTDTLLSESEILAQKRLLANELIQGIYFLIKDDEIVYVGQSTRSVYDRIFAHFHEEKKHFDSYTILQSDEENLNDLEAAYIFMCAPLYN